MKKIIFIIFVFASTNLFAQQDAMLNQYMFNKTLINPAYTGTHKNIDLVFMHREQWVTMPGAPQTSSFSIHGPIKKLNMGIGGYILRDKLGPVDDLTIMASYSYLVKFPSVTLSMGIQVGGKYSNNSYNEFDFKDKTEEASYDATNEFTPDANIGLYLYNKKFYVGLSTKQLVNSRKGIVERDGKSFYSELDRHYYLMGGYVFPITDKIICRPSTLVKYVKNSDPQFDYNLSFLLIKKIWVGGSYRTGNQMALMADWLINKKFSIGYAFDMPLETFGQHSNGTHEIILSYNFNFYQERHYTPRYF